MAAAGRDGLDPVQLQKSLFVVGEKRRDELGSRFYRFEPHNYGPFSRDIYADIDELSAEGLVVGVRPPGQSWSLFFLTDAGRVRAKEAREEAPEGAVSYLERAVSWTKRLSFAELVRSIYKHFPQYRANSIFRD